MAIKLAHPPNTHIGLRACRYLLDSGIVLDFFGKVEVANFEIASDAFATFKVSVSHMHTCCTAHKRSHALLGSCKHTHVCTQLYTCRTC